MVHSVNILHLSDIHFGAETTSRVSSTALAQRHNTLKELINTVKEVDSDWLPNVVVISGDIGFKGKEEDYRQAQLWIESLLKVVGLDSSKVVLAAGNHDIDRSKTKGMIPPNSPRDADEWLMIEHLENFERPFQAFTTFCESLGVEPFSIGEQRSHLVGVRQVEGLRFLVLNSAWFSRSGGDQDRGNLWIGLPQLELMKARSQIKEVWDDPNSELTIAVLHHPQSWLNTAELQSYDSRMNTYRLLSQSSHIILSGHEHGAVERPNKIFSLAYAFTAGASYANNQYRNNFSIYRVTSRDEAILRRSFEFDPRYGQWRPYGDKENYQLNQHSVDQKAPKAIARSAQLARYDYSSLIGKAKTHAQRYINAKLNAIAPGRPLIDPIIRLVAVHNKRERVARSTDQALLLTTQHNLTPLARMVAVGRPAFLFGDLGSGKSILVAQYIVDLADSFPRAVVPILVPVGFFRGKSLETVGKFASIVSCFVNEQVDVEQTAFNLTDALADKQEITLVLDGFDELGRQAAGQLLARAGEATRTWVGLRIIATGRPIELDGLNYDNWQCLELPALAHSEQEELLTKEGLAEGSDLKAAKDDARERLKLLSAMPELLSVATTPLTLRLIRPHLKTFPTTRSLGDLLYDIVQERLGAWNRKDDKESDLQDFVEAFPDSLSREGILGIIANEIYRSPAKSITREALHAVIEVEVGALEKRNAIVFQAIDFFRKNILQEEGGVLAFPSQPLFQFALGLFILRSLRDSDDTLDLDTTSASLWREFSFAAAVARRKNLIPVIRTKLERYMKRFVSDAEVHPAAAMIVSESRDDVLAKSFVGMLDGCPFRPLKQFGERGDLSSAAYASSFHLAGEAGFDWFFREYLDPKYPLHSIGDDLPSSILQHWLLSSKFQLTSEQKQKLSLVPEPHISTRSFQCHRLVPTIAVVLPELFNPRDRALFYVDLIGSGLLREKSCELLRKEFISGNGESVLTALEALCAKWPVTSSNAVSLWLELSRDTPPLSVIHASVVAAASPNSDAALQELEHRIGDENLATTLYWYVCQKYHLAAAAALVLRRRGETDLHVLGPALIEGHYFYAYDRELEKQSESLLLELVRAQGKAGLSWLVDQFKLNDVRYFGDSVWRILISELLHADDVYEDYFTTAVYHLGQFTLPRNPDIRRELFLLLSQRPEYKQCLERSLTSFDNRLRYNSACVLLTCFPETADLAAEIVVKGSARNSRDYEWQRFCLRLSLGESVKTHIAGLTESLVYLPKTFALALLFHNGYKLSDTQYFQLIQGLLGDASILDTVTPSTPDHLATVLAADRAFQVLTQILETEQPLAKKAASALLIYHSAKLTPALHATCWVEDIDDLHIWSTIKLEAGLKLCNRNHEFLEQAKEHARTLQKLRHFEPVAGIHVRTMSDAQAWKDMLWASLFRERIGVRDSEAGCTWILGKALRSAEVGTVVGKAAVDFLEHSAVNSRPDPGEIRLWLSLFAHEFSDISDEDLLRSILTARHQETLVAALISRLGYSPTEYHPDRDSSLLVFRRYDRIDIHNLSIDDIKEVTRDADQIHNEFGTYVEKVLLSRSLSEADLIELSASSKFGNAFAVIISYCRRELKNYDWLVQSIALFTRRYQRQQNEDPIGRAFRIIKTAVSTGDKRDDYLTAVEKNIDRFDRLESDISSADLYEELLGAKGYLSRDLVAGLLACIAANRYNLSWGLATLLSNYFANTLKDEQKAFVLIELKKSIASISGIVEDEGWKSPLRGLRECLLSLAVFWIQGSADEESARLFLLGLQGLLIEEYYPNRGFEPQKQFKAADTLSAVEPLLSRVSPNLIRQVIQLGADSDVPEQRALCQILLALSGSSNQATMPQAAVMTTEISES